MCHHRRAGLLLTAICVLIPAFHGVAPWLFGAGPLSITTTTLPTATANALYRATLTATGGTAPYRWALSAGQLPTGVSLDPGTGTLSGTPTGQGTFVFTVQVMDSAPTPASATAQETITVGSTTGAACNNISTGFTPLTDLGAGLYRGQQGGLYPGGSNSRPSTHDQAGLNLAARIAPLDGNGTPSASGKYVLLSIGMSNATLEFSAFKRVADADPQKNPHLVIVDGAQGGKPASVITNPSDPFWSTIASRLAAAGVTDKQVVAAWIKEAEADPTAAFPADATQLQSDLAAIARILQSKYPNLKLAYLSSRIYAGYATTPLNPEPFAYQSGFAVKWLIQSQITGDMTLNFDPAKGSVAAPWLAWGPYLWADGLTPRSDGLTWSCQELQADGTHPSVSGQAKVATLLLNFFKGDATAQPWFVAGGSLPTPTVTPTLTGCTPRPNVGIAAVPTGTGGLRVTVQATSSAAAPTNALVALQFASAQGALIDIPGGPTGSGGNFSVSLPPGLQQTSFTIRPVSGATAGTAPFTVVDQCGSWPTFVGAGPGGWLSQAPAHEPALPAAGVSSHLTAPTPAALDSTAPTRTGAPAVLPLTASPSTGSAAGPPTGSASSSGASPQSSPAHVPAAAPALAAPWPLPAAAVPWQRPDSLPPWWWSLPGAWSPVPSQMAPAPPLLPSWPVAPLDVVPDAETPPNP